MKYFMLRYSRFRNATTFVIFVRNPKLCEQPSVKRTKHTWTTPASVSICVLELPEGLADTYDVQFIVKQSNGHNQALFESFTYR